MNHNTPVHSQPNFSATCIVAKEEMYMRDGLYLSGKGAGVFADGLKQAVDSGLGNVHYLN